MYPTSPTVVMDASTDLARTGFPVASLLTLATVLLLTGLFLVRRSRSLARADA